MDRTADELLEIVLTECVPGDRIQSVEQLAVRFEVSRAVVREAVARLTAKGFLEVRHGDGTYARTPDLDDLRRAMRLMVHSNMKDKRSLFLDVMEVRRVFEGEATRLAAQRATGDDIGRIKDALDRGRQAHEKHDQGLINAADLDFHYAIIRSSHNDLLVLVGDMIQPLLLELRAMYPSERAISTSRDHEQIFRAVLEHRADDAFTAAVTHIEHVNNDLSGILFGLDDRHDTPDGRG